MNNNLEEQVRLVVRSFAYVAHQVAQASPAEDALTVYHTVCNEAEKHRAALRLQHRDERECVEQALRLKVLTKEAGETRLQNAQRHIQLADTAIQRIVSSYMPRAAAA